jgi:hypothetical protein
MVVPFRGFMVGLQASGHSDHQIAIRLSLHDTPSD